MLDLPQPIKDHLFDAFYVANDVAVDHVADQLESLGFVVTGVAGDSVIKLFFKSERTKGVLRIQRVERNFAVEATCNGEQFMPARGDWPTVSKYLANLRRADHG